MTTKKDELNRRWAQLEGWKYHEWEKFDSMNDEMCQFKCWESPDHVNYDIDCLPDWTEPNRFFTEVVSRMNDLNFMISNISQRGHGFFFAWKYFEPPKEAGAEQRQATDLESVFRNGLIEAGLESAINARKTLNV